MKTYKFLILTLGALLFASCEKELDRDLTDVSVTVATNENVRYEGNILTVKKGTPVETSLMCCIWRKKKILIIREIRSFSRE